MNGTNIREVVDWGRSTLIRCPRLDPVVAALVFSAGVCWWFEEGGKIDWSALETRVQIILYELNYLKFLKGSTVNYRRRSGVTQYRILHIHYVGRHQFIN